MKEEFKGNSFRVGPRLSQRKSAFSGFTIVELLIAMGVFTVLLGIVVGTFIGSLRSQRSIVAIMLVNDNASLVLEQMAREIRTGENFFINGNQLTFKNANGVNVGYKLNNSAAIEREVAGSPLAITSDKVKVSRLDFVLVDRTDWPPKITILLEVSPKTVAELSQVKTVVQTTVSARNF